MSKIEPMFDRVVVREHEGEAKTAGGIIIPEAAQRKAYRGTVISVGRGKRDPDGELIPMDVAVGDEVLYGKFSGTEFKVDGVTYLTLPQTDIMCKIMPDEPTGEGQIAVDHLRMGDERVVDFEDESLTGHKLA